MRVRTPILLSLALVLPLLMPVFPGAMATHDGPPTVQPLDGTANTFWFHTSDDLYCSDTVAKTREEGFVHPALYATNTEADPCAETTFSTSEGIIPTATTYAFQVRFLPVLDSGLVLDEGASIPFDLWIWTEGTGGVSPRLTLNAPGWSSAHDEGARLTTADLVITQGGITWHRYTGDLGPAPATFGIGKMTVSIDVSNDVDDQRRVSTLRTGIGTVGAHKSSLTLPIVAEDDQTAVHTWPLDIDDAVSRPGVQHVTGNSQCTTNFVFRDRVTDALYIGTAAHCVDNIGIGGPSTVRGMGGSIDTTLAYSSWRSGESHDFAVLRVDPADEDKVHPAMLGFGGPTHLADSARSHVGDKVITFGNSGLRPGPQQLDKHEGYVVFKGARNFEVWTVTPGVPGDSGSAMLDDEGGAMGVVVTISYIGATNGITGLKYALDRARDHGFDLEVQTHEIIDPGLLPDVI